MGELVALAHRDVLRDIVAVPLALRDATEADAVEDAPPLIEPTLREPLGVGDALGLPLPLGDGDALGDALGDCVALAVHPPLGGVDAVDVVDTDGAAEGVRAAGDEDGDAVPSRPVRDCDTDAEAQPELLAEPDGDGDGDGVCDGDAEPPSEAHAVGVVVSDAPPLDDAPLEPLRVVDTVPLTQRDALRDSVGEPLAERDTTVPVGDVLRGALADSPPLRLPLAVVESLTLSLALALGAPLREALPEPLGLKDALALAEGDPDAPPDRDGDGVLLGEPHALPLREAVRRAVALPRAVPVVEPLTLRLREELDVSEGDTLPLRLRKPLPLDEGHGVAEELPPPRLREGLGVVLPDLEGEAVEDEVPLALCDTLLLTLEEQEALGEGEGDALEVAEEVEVAVEVPPCSRRARSGNTELTQRSKSVLLIAKLCTLPPVLLLSCCLQVQVGRCQWFFGGGGRAWRRVPHTKNVGGSASVCVCTRAAACLPASWPGWSHRDAFSARARFGRGLSRGLAWRPCARVAAAPRIHPRRAARARPAHQQHHGLPGVRPDV